MSSEQIHFDLSIDDTNLRESVLKISKEIRAKWKQENDDSSIEIRDLNGGITNRLVACYLGKNGLDTSDTLLFRMYGKNTEKFISRESEISTMNLMKSIDLGPQFYCRFNNGICYEYLPGRICDQQMVYDEKVWRQISHAVAKLNLVNFDSSQSKKPFIFAKIKELLSLVQPDYKEHMPHMNDEYFKKIPSFQSLHSEVEFLETHLIEYTKKHKSLLVFSHNDLLLGNIIYNESLNTVKFIDYEYGDYNFQAYDIANHFNEFSGVDQPDYSYFPSKDYQLKWLQVYLESFYAELNQQEKFKLDDKKLNQFYVEVNKFTLASHLMWAIWSLVQAQSSQLEFNFVHYAQIRFDQYFKTKPHLISLD